MRIVASASAHKPQKMHLPRSSVVGRQAVPASAARSLPVGAINLRLAAGVAGDFYRRLRITRCDDACLQTLTKSFKHNQRSVPEYEKLKLLFTTGKSGMMLPRKASLNAGQF